MPEPPRDNRTNRPRAWLEPRGLAIAGLVLALVPCCPMTGLLGSFLGVFALRRIRLAGGKPHGARIAIAAIVTGAASALVWSIALDQISAAQQEAMEREVDVAVATALAAAQNDDHAALLDVWSTTGEPPTADDAAAFGRVALERFGPVDRFGFISMARSGTLLRPIIHVAGVGHFEDGEPLLAARLEVRVVIGRIQPVVRLLELTIEDEPRGDVRLASSPAAEDEAGADPPAPDAP